MFCEKPVDLSARTASAPASPSSKAAGTPLMIGFNRRFDPNFAALQAPARRRARSAMSRSSPSSRAIPARRRSTTSKRSGGLFRDMMIHDLDMARFLLGEEPVEVHAVGSSLVDPGHRRGRRRRHRGGAAEDRVRQDRADLELAPRHLRLRPAHRGARLQGHAPRRQRARDARSKSPTAPASRADPVQNFFLERYAAAYRDELDGLPRRRSHQASPDALGRRRPARPDPGRCCDGIGANRSGRPGRLIACAAGLGIVPQCPGWRTDCPIQDLGGAR